MLASGPIEVEVDALPEADRDPEAVMTVWGLSWVLTRTSYLVFTVGVAAASAFACAQLGGDGRGLVALCVLLGVAALSAPTRLHIKPAGIAIRWLFVRRLVRHQEIEDASVYDEKHWGRWREVGLRLVVHADTLYIPMTFAGRVTSWLTDPTRKARLALAWLDFHRERDLTARALHHRAHT